jgi:hypothetical protein
VHESCKPVCCRSSVSHDPSPMLQQRSAALDRVSSVPGADCAAGALLCRRLVDPNRGDAGFSPHRDRQPDDSPATFRPDGSAMYATMWVPLTPATPENSCLYVIPRWVHTCRQGRRLCCMGVQTLGHQLAALSLEVTVWR